MNSISVDRHPPKKFIRIEAGQDGQQAVSRSGAREGWGGGVGGAPLLETSLLAILACLNAEIFFGGGGVPVGGMPLRRGTSPKI